MAAVDVPLSPMAGAGSFQIFPEVSDPIRRPILSRKRRMNFYDLANLLDSDGNLQNEMLVFAFAATMLSTIPVLLGNEFDVNVGLRRKKRDLPEAYDPSESSYVSYTDTDDNFPPAFFSNYTYKRIMTTPKGTKDVFHIHNDSSTLPQDLPLQMIFQESAAADEDMAQLLRELMDWSQAKIKDKPLLPMLINLALDKYHGYKNPADKLVKTAYKKWRNFTW